MRRPVLALALVAAIIGCAGGRAARSPDAGSPEAALRSFAAALQDNRFDAAHALLSARWRAAYTPRQLAIDLAGAGPAGRESARRAVSALDGGAPLVRQGDAAWIPVGGERAAILVREDGGWRVDALE